MDKQQNKSYYHAVNPSRKSDPTTIVGSIINGDLREVERLVDLGYNVSIHKI